MLVNYEGGTSIGLYKYIYISIPCGKLRIPKAKLNRLFKKRKFKSIVYSSKHL